MSTRLRRLLPLFLGMAAFLFGATLVSTLRDGESGNYLLLGLAELLLVVLFGALTLLNRRGT